MLKNRLFCAAGISLFISLSASADALPQAGAWAFEVVTDLSKIPKEMRENFPTINFERCIKADEIASPKAFGLQTSAQMGARCSHPTFSLADGNLAYTFECDSSTTLTGEARGNYAARRVNIQLISRPVPVVRGINTVHQKITAKFVGQCKN